MESVPLCTNRMTRAIFDFVLAGCICLAAAGYWAWDARSTPQPLSRANRDTSSDDGYKLFSASDYTGAEAQFRRAVQANPRSAVAHCNLGASLIALRRYDEAIAALQTASALDPSLALARNNLNWALEEKAKGLK